MKLEPASGIEIDIDDRFRQEIRGFPRTIRPEGNGMQTAIVKKLLERNTDHISIANDGVPVQCMSLENYGTRFLEVFLENREPPQGLFLLHTIPEELLVKYAEHHGIPVVREEKTPVRKMLERIREEQPQTFFTLAKSAERLTEKVGSIPDSTETGS